MIRRELTGSGVIPFQGCDTLPFSLKPVAWAEDGYYFDPEERPGRHPLHEAGAYYIQEPSAMSVVSLLDPQPGELVCDLCAAPGGKSTHIAALLRGQGMLVSNEIFPNRARILSQNIERMGIPNALVCNESPEGLATHFPLFFHRIVVDAPCSGEGMFRKDDTAVSEWSLENVRICADRQRMILTQADQMLQPGGVLVYSTCTFAPDEDEAMIQWFLETHPDYTLTDWHDTALGQRVADLPDHSGPVPAALPHTPTRSHPAFCVSGHTSSMEKDTLLHVSSKQVHHSRPAKSCRPFPQRSPKRNSAIRRSI